MQENGTNRNGLPEGWKLLTLKDIGKVTSGGTPSTQVSEYWYDEVAWITPADLSNYSSKYISKGRKNISQKGLKSSSAKLLPKGTVLFSSRAPIGYVVIAANELATNQGFKNLIPNESIDSSYLYYYLKASKKLAEDHASGTTFKEISASKFAELPIPVPPKDQQHHIVSRLEELFSELDKSIEQLKTAQQQLKVYRQAVLQRAFEGKLTGQNQDSQDERMEQDALNTLPTHPENFANPANPDSDNLPDAHDFLHNAGKTQANQDNQENQGSDNLPEGWKWVKSGDLFEFVTSGSRGWAKYYSNEGSIFIRITNLDFDSLELDLTPEKIQHVSIPESTDGYRARIQEGDFLFSVTGYLGMFAIAPKFENAFVNQHIALCRPKGGFEKKFVGYWIISRTGGNYHLNKMNKGATKAGLSLDDIRNFPVPIAQSNNNYKSFKKLKLA